MEKDKKCYTKIINWKYQIDHIPYQAFKIKHEAFVENPSIKIFVNKVENRITFETKTGHYFEPLTFETIKLFGITKSKINKDRNGNKVPHIEITEVVLIHRNIVANSY